ncbi:hypothetical protein [Enterovibrio norvegicus]|uniref:hypothetical protein n=1 Tax=Enterovibrio norvegicus TaxID=188144 RepID=UPI00352DF425
MFKSLLNRKLRLLDKQPALLSTSDIEVLTELSLWLEDNVDQSTPIIFDNEGKVGSETVLPALKRALDKLKGNPSQVAQAAANSEKSTETFSHWLQLAKTKIGDDKFQALLELFHSYGYGGTYEMEPVSAMAKHMEKNGVVLSGYDHRMTREEKVAWLICNGLTLEKANDSLQQLERDFADRLCRFMG